MNHQTDIIVIGGGPAGSTVAALLADAGWGVTLFERDQFPREHVGESLIPAAVQTLRRLGVKAELDRRGFLRKRGTTFVWGSGQEPWTVYFVEGNPLAGFSYQLHRPEFDELLLQTAARFGVRVHQRAAVAGVLRDGDAVVGVTASIDGAAPEEWRARLVIDASGQAGVVARALGLRQWDADIRNMAVYGYWQGSDRLPGIDAPNTLVEAFEEGWIWHIPLHTGQVSVGAIIDSAAYERHRADWRGAYHRLVGRSRVAAGLLRSARFVGGPHLVRDWSYTASRYWGPGYLLLGDAACFIDPLFSTGVHLAMQQANNAAACANAWLRGDVSADEAFGLYESEYREEYQDLRQIVLLMYASAQQPVESVFWGARRILGLPDGFDARRAFLRLVSGRQRLGFEANPLTRMDLPDHLRHEMSAVEREVADHLATLPTPAEGDAGHPLLGAVLARDASTTVEQKYLVAGDTLRRGYVVRSGLNPRGVPADPFTVEAVLPLADGSRTVRDIVRAAVAGSPAASAPADAPAILRTLYELYRYGALKVVAP